MLIFVLRISQPVASFRKCVKVLFLAGAVTNAIPGIILQLVLIPVLVLAMERAGLSLIPQEESGEP